MKHRLIRVLTVLSCLFFGCSAFSSEKIPYIIFADFVMDENSSDYEICGVELAFYNKELKAVKEFTVDFFLFDKDGEPAFECSGRLSFDVIDDVESGENYNCCLSLDRYMRVIPEEALMVDYLFVSKIVYEDGSIWEDKFGLYAFR